MHRRSIKRDRFSVPNLGPKSGTTFARKCGPPRSKSGPTTGPKTQKRRGLNATWQRRPSVGAFPRRPAQHTHTHTHVIGGACRLMRSMRFCLVRDRLSDRRMGSATTRAAVESSQVAVARSLLQRRCTSLDARTLDMGRGAAANSSCSNAVIEPMQLSRKRVSDRRTAAQP